MIFEPRPPHTSIIPIATCTTYNIYLISHCGWKKERRLERNILLENNPFPPSTTSTRPSQEAMILLGCILMWQEQAGGEGWQM